MDQNNVEHISNLIAVNGLNILTAAAIYIVGRWVTQLISGGMQKMLQHRHVDQTLASFARNLIYYTLMTFVILAVLGRLGIQTASFIAVLGAAGFAVGMALQGSLSNFAAGVMIVMFRPFKVGDVITAGGISGQVMEIQIFNVILHSADNVRIIVPNSQVIGGNIQNFSANETRRVDLIFGISYKDDIQKARSVIEQVLKADKKVLANPAPLVAVAQLGDNSVNLAVRPWSNNADYWDVYFGLNEKIKNALEANGITIPFPQREVRLVGAPAALSAAGRG